MCLAIPGKIVSTISSHGLRMGVVDYDGTTQTVCLEYVPDAVPGQYVLVHAGFAINVLDESEARKTLDLCREIAAHNVARGLDPLGRPPKEKDRPS